MSNVIQNARNRKLYNKSVKSQISFTVCHIKRRHNSQLFKYKFLIGCPNFRPPSAAQHLVLGRSDCLSLFARCQQTVPWLGRSDAGLSPRRLGFDPNSFYVGVVVGKFGNGTGSSHTTSLFPVSTIPPSCRTLSKLSINARTH